MSSGDRVSSVQQATYPEARRPPSVLVRSVDQLASLVGEELPPGEWHAIGQERVDGFAAATGDFQWIHVDRERARSGPFGTTIAHGYLTLALVPVLLSEVIELDRRRVVTMNYGIDRARFPAPLPVGSEIRATARVESVASSVAGSRIRFAVTVQARRADRPVLVADLLWVARFTEEADR